MGSKGRMPPYHHRPLPGPGPGPVDGVMHGDPYGPGMHPPPGPGPFPYDMLPPPEILEQKLVAQRGEMQKLAVENDWLAASHVSLRKELAAAQQELQRLQAQGEAARAAQDQEMRRLLDKAAKMEADLKSCESVKAELQQAHVEAQNLVAVRQHLAADAQKLSKDLQRNLGEAQQLPVLSHECDAARQEYQHLRATYEYERKLRMDHSESRQARTPLLVWQTLLMEAQLAVLLALDLIHQEAIHMTFLVLLALILPKLEAMMHQGLPLAMTL